MIVDSSAVVAAIFQESERERIVNALDAGEIPAIGSPTLLETELVLSSRAGEAGRDMARRFVATFGLEEIPFDARHRSAATEAFLRFGKGRHPAALNFGDCLTYAVAKLADEPLLCVGDDFAKTDLELVG